MYNFLALEFQNIIENLKRFRIEVQKCNKTKSSIGNLPSGLGEFNRPSSPNKDAGKVKQCAQYPHSASGQMLAALPANQIVTPKSLLGSNSGTSKCP